MNNWQIYQGTKQELNLKTLTAHLSGHCLSETPFEVKVPNIVTCSEKELLNFLVFLGDSFKQKGQKEIKTLVLQERQMSSEMLHLAWQEWDALFQFENLEQRLKRELSFGDNQLDQAVCIRPRPLGIVGHITAGNIFLGLVDSLIMGVLTRNCNVIKLSHGNQKLGELMARCWWDALCEKPNELYRNLLNSFAFCYFSHHERHFIKDLKESVDALMVWGAEESTLTWKKDLPLKVKFIEYGPKVSFAVFKPHPDDYPTQLDWEKLAQDFSLWDGLACASPQVLYIDEKFFEPAFLLKVMASLTVALGNYPYPRRALSNDEWVEKQKVRATACMLHFEFAQIHQISDFPLPVMEENFLIYIDHRDGFITSALYRTVVIKKWNQNLKQEIKKAKLYLQTTGLWCDSTSNQFTHEQQELLNLGLKRVVSWGNMLKSELGEPHDGRRGLLELVEWVSYEKNIRADQEIALRKKLQFWTDLYPSLKIHQNKELKDFPLMDKHSFEILSQEIQDQVYQNPHHFFQDSQQKGLLCFASGATTGEPKYSYFTAQEFEDVANNLATVFLSQGIKEFPVVANLFVAGQMWSSFLAVEKALEKCPVVQLPIGGLTSSEQVASYFARFQPQAVFGIPSLVAQLALKFKAKVKAFYYAGEMLESYHREILQSQWGVEKFFSAGLASVDAGMIAYPDPLDDTLYRACPGVIVEEVNEELVVTNYARVVTPIIRYRTGDKIKWVDKNAGHFRFLGRGDGLIMWQGVRISPDIIKEHFLNNHLEMMQIFVENQVLHLILNSDDTTINHQKILLGLYPLCEDLNKTYTSREFEELINTDFIKIETRKNWRLNARTGKSKR